MQCQPTFCLSMASEMASTLPTSTCWLFSMFCSRFSQSEICENTNRFRWVSMSLTTNENEWLLAYLQNGFIEIGRQCRRPRTAAWLIFRSCLGWEWTGHVATLQWSFCGNRKRKMLKLDETKHSMSPHRVQLSRPLLSHHRPLQFILISKNNPVRQHEKCPCPSAVTAE